jgi:hypothetical protein
MGASAELGAAIATALFFKKSAVYVVGPHVDQNIFFYHPIVQQKNTIEDVLQDMASLRLLDAVKSAVV